MRPIDQQLLNACKKSDIHIAQKLLQQSANPNTKDPRRGQTPFLIAHKNCDIPML